MTIYHFQDENLHFESLNLRDDMRRGSVRPIQFGLPPGFTVSSKVLVLEDMDSRLQGDIEMTIPYSAPPGHFVHFYAVINENKGWERLESGSFNFNLGRISFSSANLPKSLCE